LFLSFQAIVAVSEFFFLAIVIVIIIMFEARLAKGLLLKKIIDAIKDLITEASWDFTKEGIMLQAMDSSHVSLVYLNLKSDGFDAYHCSNSLTMGMNIKSFYMILKCASDGDMITLKAQDDPRVLNIVFEANNNREKISEYEMKLIDLDVEHFEIPDKEYACVMRFNSPEFKKICTDSLRFGDVITINCTTDGVRFSSSSDKLITGNVTYRSENKDIDIKITQPVGLSFSLQTLIHITKATPLSTFVQLSLTPNEPLLVEYKIEDFGNLKYYLAPNISEVPTSSDN
jgi:proliferating cell nuclear antigen